MAVIVVENVGRIYHSNGAPVNALNGINIEIERGEFVCLAGPSGSGKTTLLNIMGLIDRPTSGRVMINDVRIMDLGRSGTASMRLENMGFVFQTFNLMPVFTAFENVEYVLMLKGYSKRERAGMTAALLERVGLSDMMDKRPNELSGGQQQRVAAARAVAGSPAMVFADEPTGSLDTRSGMELMALFRSLNEEMGTTFVFSSHDERVIGCSSRTVMMCDGRITEIRSELI